MSHCMDGHTYHGEGFLQLLAWGISDKLPLPRSSLPLPPRDHRSVRVYSTEYTMYCNLIWIWKPIEKQAWIIPFIFYTSLKLNLHHSYCRLVWNLKLSPAFISQFCMSHHHWLSRLLRKLVNLDWCEITMDVVGLSSTWMCWSSFVIIWCKGRTK